MPASTSMPTPIPYHVPPGIKTYTGPADWRVQHPAGAIPSDPDRMSRFWSDPRAATLSEPSGGIPGFPQFGERTSSPLSFTYTLPMRDQTTGAWHRCKINSNEFLRSYSRSLAHSSMVNLMREYAWVYELLGNPVILAEVTFTAKEASEGNFNGGLPNYPINLRSDYVYFTQDNQLVCLSHRDFIEYFKPQGVTDYASMRRTVRELAESPRLSDEAAISMIRLATREAQKPIVI